MTYESLEELAYPGVFSDENEIIPYSPRKRFGFTYPLETASDKILDKSKIIKLESMDQMSIDQIVELYKYGYRIEDISPNIETAQGISISTGALLLIGIGVLAYLYMKKNR